MVSELGARADGSYRPPLGSGGSTRRAGDLFQAVLPTDTGTVGLTAFAVRLSVVDRRFRVLCSRRADCSICAAPGVFPREENEATFPVVAPNMAKKK